LTLSLLVILFISPVSAQKKADKLFENRQYYAAAQVFEKELADGKRGNPIEIRKKTGICYLKINQPEKALHWLQQAAAGNTDADLCYQYGLALQQTANYAGAIETFGQCLRIQPGHPTAPVKIESCRFAMTNSRVNPYVKFRPATELNTPGGEFGASLYANNMVYYSSAAAPAEGTKIDQRTGLQYVTTYMMRVQNKRFIYPQAADNTLPKYVNEGLFTYDSIAKCVYFTHYDPDNNCSGLYASKLVSGKWTEPEIILQNKKDQVSGQPAIANGGNRLYFTSNLSDGAGQTDIWYMDRSDDGKWGLPVNAGNTINTFGREEFPFVHADTLLFFASDGHIGYGGLDIFCSVIKGNSFSTPVNLLRPFNSQGDDFSLVITSGNTGLLSSSRNELMSDDIYFFEGLPSFQYLSGHVTDYFTGAPLKDTRLTLSVDGTNVQQAVSDSTGYYGFFLHKDKSPMMYARTIGYKPSLTDVPLTGTKQFDNINHDVQLQQSAILPATVQLYSKITGNPVVERGIICYNNDGETQILRTDASGSFKLTMQEDQREYWIKFPDGNYLTESIILNEEQKSYSLAVQPLNGDLFTGWLHFKRGSIEATEMSQALIPRIAAVIKANPGMVFQVEGFCDTGFEARQPNLAIQRAESIVRRLIDEGVDKRLLSALAGREAGTTIEEDAGQRRVEIKVKR
jgi:tetratricopeptide (TPR) repeat protein/outer membrane protein OmpA-like peptidoglycan-associated protein